MTPERAEWLSRVPETLRDLEHRWSLTLFVPYQDASCACGDGTSAALKLGMPHMEGEHEIQALRFWNGDPTVRLLNADDELSAKTAHAAGTRAGPDRKSTRL